MFYEGLAIRAERCSELNRMLEANPEDKKAGDWIAEISKKALNRREDRHLAIVRMVHGLRRQIVKIEALSDDLAPLKEHRDRLQSRVDAMKPDATGHGRFVGKLALLDERIEENVPARKKAMLPGLRRRLAELSNSSELLTKEDVLDG